MELKECLTWEDLESIEWEVCELSGMKLTNTDLLKALPLGMGNVGERKYNQWHE